MNVKLRKNIDLNKLDLENLLTKAWRDKVISGVLDALDNWSIEDAAHGRLLRQ